MKQVKKTKRTFRSERIGSFFKTEHFLKRQWERKVPNEMLSCVLKEIKSINKKRYIIISRNIVSAFCQMKEELFIVTDGTTLVTCFYESLLF